jgi:hypothetical protein
MHGELLQLHDRSQLCIHVFHARLLLAALLFVLQKSAGLGICARLRS